MKLMLAGSIFWGESELSSLMKELNIESEIIFTGRVPDAELRNIMGAAYAMTYLPYFEGFGIPLVEAMQSGIPIIAAKASCLPEIAGDEALYANPFDEHEIKNAMLTLYNDDSLRAELIKQGNKRKDDFSWDRTASLLWNSIEKTVS